MSTTPKSYLHLSALVAKARAAHARLGLAPSMPLRDAAALAAVESWGLDVVESAHELVNMAALGVASPKPLPVHQVRPAAARHIAETDLHSVPDERPRLLRAPWLLEVRRPEAGEALFGDTFALGGYELDGVTFLVGLTLEGGSRVATWRPTWTGGELDEGTKQSHSHLVEPGNVGPWQDWARAAARFSVVYALLVEAEGTPLRVESGRQRDNPAGLAVSNVYLDGALGDAAGAVPAAAHATGLIPSETSVRGHLRRQRYGHELALVKWVYIAQHGAWRWVRPV
ncbi:hypothetical protein [Myxococcus sp. CA040A]|uniref:hypothetical protein n=1 Tax=Myxococcus sp. CA040A TaxID=2741738 RepID=UPI00157B0839|nr:hypothetical protein [Myxococcus sp. CA040A]NTX07026.1 hypothetical protein [Myxococcus sp. CA040A]